MSNTKREITDADLERLLDARGNLTMYSFERGTWEQARDRALDESATLYRRRQDAGASLLRDFANVCDEKAKERARLADKARAEAKKVQREVLPWEAGPNDR